MQVLHETFIDDPNITVLAVHWDGRDDPAAYLEKHGYTFPMVVDGRNIAEAFGVTQIPMFVVVGPDVTVRDTHLGRLTDTVRDRLMDTARSAAPAASQPPPATQAWMDRLTVPHAYDPGTGFIVAKETTPLPPVLANAPPLDEAIGRAGDERTVVAFATADRCAPCQQFKKDALRDPRVVARLNANAMIVTHVEVDRQGELADAYLGGRAIPMSYALRDGVVVGTLRGQRSADELLAWLDAVAGGA